MKVYFIIISLLFFPALHGQKRVNVEEIFKMNLFLDKQVYQVTDIIKTDSLYQTFSNRMSFDMVQLETENINNEFEFFLIDVKTIKTEVQDCLSDSILFMGVMHGFVSEFIICVNVKTGRSYRIKGFDGNDFYNFLVDFKDLQYYYEGITSDKYFLKEVKVEKVDFRCLYKGLREKKRDPYKYPCLRRVSDLVHAH